MLKLKTITKRREKAIRLKSLNPRFLKDDGRAIFAERKPTQEFAFCFREI